MTHLTFGVSASPFAANMSVKQNVLDLMSKYPLTAAVVEKSFYVDCTTCIRILFICYSYRIGVGKEENWSRKEEWSQK